METFIAILSRDATRASAALDRAGRALRGLYGRVYGDAASFEHHRHAVGSLSVLAVQFAGQRRSTIAFTDTPQLTACVFADRPGRVFEALMGGGVEAVRKTNASFGGVVFDRESNTLLAAGDVCGQRSLRYAQAEGMTIVSPHDVGVLATGLVPYELDTTSAASAFSIGWSVRGVPLVRGVTRVQPMEQVELSSDAATARRLEPLGAAYERAEGSHADAVVQAQLEHLDAVLPTDRTITVELSAGLDSRGSLAAALALRPKARLQVFSDGGPESLDVRVAREIAQQAGVAFDNPPPRRRPPADAVIRELGHLALAANGTGEALAFMTNRPTDFSRDPDVSVSGDGGEIFSGFYFPYRPFLPQTIEGVRPRDAFASKFRLKQVAWAQPDLQSALSARLEATFADLEVEAADALDVLDRLYAFERYGVWNNKLERCHGNGSRFSPYSSRCGIRAAYAGTTAEKRACSPQATLIRRHLPGAVSIPINGVRRLDLDDYGGPGRIAGDAYEFAAKALRKVRRKVEAKLPFARGEEGESLHRLRANVLIELLDSGFEEQLREATSPAVSVLGERALGDALQALRGGDDFQANMIAMAVMMNLYTSLCAEVAGSEDP